MTPPTPTHDKGGLGRILVVLAAMLWGTTGTSQALAPAMAHPVCIGALRLLVGGACLLGLILWRGAGPKGCPWTKRDALLGGFFVALYQLSFFAGVKLTGVAVGTVVGIGSSPIFAGLLDYVVYRNKPGRLWMGATALSIVGNTLLVLAADSLSVNVWGLLLALGAGFSYAVYSLLCKRLLQQSYSPDALMAVVFCAGAVMLLPVLPFFPLSWVFQPSGLLIVLHLGVLATALSYVLFARGLAYIPSPTAITLSLAEPLTAGVLGVAVLGERLTLVSSLGILLLFLGLALLTIQPKGN